MSAPSTFPTYIQTALQIIGGFIAGILAFMGSKKVARANEFSAILNRISEIEERADSLAAKVDIKEREVQQATQIADIAMQAKRRADGQSELLLNEIETLKWRQGIFLRIIQSLADRIKMTPEERHNLFDELHMDPPPSLTSFKVTDTVASATAHIVEVSTQTETVDGGTDG